MYLRLLRILCIPVCLSVYWCLLTAAQVLQRLAGRLLPLRLAQILHPARQPVAKRQFRTILDVITHINISFSKNTRVGLFYLNVHSPQECTSTYLCMYPIPSQERRLFSQWSFYFPPSQRVMLGLGCLKVRSIFNFFFKMKPLFFLEWPFILL